MELARLLGTEATIGPARLSECEIVVEPQCSLGPIYPIETEQKVELAHAIETEDAIGPARLSEGETTIELRSRPGILGATAGSTIDGLK